MRFNYLIKIPNVKQLICGLLALFCLFPFTTIIDFGTYTQPYALLLGIVFVPFLFNTRLDFSSAVALSWLLLLGVVLYIYAILSEPLIGPLKYLVAYLTPLLVVFPTFYLSRYHQEFFRKLVFISSFIWLITGIIQILVYPEFLTFLSGSWASASEVVVRSGRGVIALAPEPTAFGFHLIILGALYYLLSNDMRASVLILSGSLLLALSASSLLVIMMAISASLIGLIRFRFLLNTFLIGIPFLFGLYILITSFFSLEDFTTLRVGDLLLLAYENPELLLADSSVNARLGGLLVAIIECYERMFLPFGLSYSDWTVERELILAKYSFLYKLSLAGFPSGYFIQLYQGGFLFIPFLFYMVYKTFAVRLFPSLSRWLILSAIIVPFFQFSFATPTFWLFWGVFLERTSQSKNKVVFK